jgi:hypothetical protein
MAGQITTHSASHAIFQRIQNAFARRQLVEASVEMMGHTFRTNIREGASAEDLIEKIAKENGGGVAKVYYPELKTWEIVAVKIGDQVLVKGEPDKVANADFSQFSDPENFRGIALRAAENSEGGIHFSIGKSGIPFAIIDQEQIVFPNAEELRIGRNTNNISLWMTSVNVNPVSLADLSQNYSSSGGLQVSRDALQKIEESHGGARCDKLLLEDNILVLNKDTGEIFTASQFSSAPQTPYAPSFDFDFRASYSIHLDALPVQSQIHNHDGNQFRNPYLLVKTFDGQALEQVRIQMNPAPELTKAGEKAPAENSKQQKTSPVPQLVFSLLRFESTSDGKPPDDFPPPKGSSPASVKAKAAKTNVPNENISQIPPRHISTETIIRKWSEPRTARIPLGIPSSALPIETKERTFRNKLPREIGIHKDKTQTQDRQAIKPKRKPHRREMFRPIAPAELKPKAMKKPDIPKKIKQKRSKRVYPNLTEVRHEKKTKPKTRKDKSAIDTQTKPLRKKSRISKLSSSMEKPKSFPTRKIVKSEMKKPKKMSRYFYYQLLGLYPWKKRGRKLSTKKKSAV